MCCRILHISSPAPAHRPNAPFLAVTHSFRAEPAKLLQVYQACQLRGRIAYKKAGGSRLITHNDHWKSQIRHALYTCDRFQRYLPLSIPLSNPFTVSHKSDLPYCL